jgi:Flp pilus assembly protein TadB
MIQDEMKDNLSEMKEEFREYVEHQINLTKLHMVETLSKLTAGFAVKLGVLYLLFFAILCISLAMAFFIGSLLESNGLGFAVVALMYVILALLFYALRRSLVEKPIITSYINLFFPNFDDYEDKK